MLTSRLRSDFTSEPTRLMPASNFSRISYSKRALRLVAMTFSSDAADFFSFALMATEY